MLSPQPEPLLQRNGLKSLCKGVDGGSLSPKHPQPCGTPSSQHQLLLLFCFTRTSKQSFPCCSSTSAAGCALHILCPSHLGFPHPEQHIPVLFLPAGEPPAGTPRQPGVFQEKKGNPCTSTQQGAPRGGSNIAFGLNFTSAPWPGLTDTLQEMDK